MGTRLEIDEVWLRWRGDLQDYHDGIATMHIFAMREDPMDRDGYKEAVAFPMRKPNFDVFGIPGRTRKQRGWYQVQPHPKSRPKQHAIFLAPESSPGVSATGADIPTELVRLVGEMMSQRLWAGDDEDRSTMVTCALVCRHWASQFLPKILNCVEIHSRRRAFGLWEFDRSPARCFHRGCDSFVSVDVNRLSELSFMHLLAQMRCRKIDVRLQGPLPRGWKTLRSVHQALPQSLPRSLSVGITRLQLRGIHFQRFSDLTHLVCELTDLEYLVCDKVTCGPLPDTIATFPRLRRTSSSSPFLTRMDADMGMPAAVHLLAHILTTKESPLLPRVGAVLALASLVTGVCNMLTHNAPAWASAYCSWDLLSLGR